MTRSEVVLITGGLGGLGAALARALLRDGAAVALADTAAAQTAGSGAPDWLEALPPAERGRARVYAVDVADEAALRSLVSAVAADLGALTSVIANAGVPGGGGIDAPDEVWEQSWRVNTMAHVHLARVVVPGMLARGGGQFVSVASAAGLLTNLGNAPYSVTKHAAVAFAEWLAITYGDQGLDVRLVAPMGVDTGMLRSGRGTLAGESVVALGVLSPDEAAARIMQGLASDDFLVLTHPQVGEFERQRVGDRDRWLAGMRRTQTAIEHSMVDPAG